MYENKFWTWLVQSSADPEKVATTVKGALLMYVPIILVVLHLLKVDSIGGDKIQTIIDLVGVIITVVLGIVSACMTVYGLIRKIVLTVKP